MAQHATTNQVSSPREDESAKEIWAIIGRDFGRPGCPMRTGARRGSSAETAQHSLSETSGSFGLQQHSRCNTCSIEEVRVSDAETAQHS